MSSNNPKPSVQPEKKNGGGQAQLRKTHQAALDDLVNVNQIFTAAVFLGLNIASPNQRPLYDKPGCPSDIGRRLVVNEVISFAWFLLSSIVAKALSLHLSISTEKGFETVRNMLIRTIMLLLSVTGSVMGCIYLTVSMVDVIQVKLGMLACGSYKSWKTAGAMVGVVLVALGIYVSFTLAAIYACVQEAEKQRHAAGKKSVSATPTPRP